jgi:hypothetical protein
VAPLFAAVLLALAPASKGDAAPSGASPATAASTSRTEPRATDAPPPPQEDPSGRRGKRLAAFSREGNPLARRTMIGMGGAFMQTSPLRVRALSIDPRDVGTTTSLGGLGVFARHRVRPLVGFDVDVRSGSIRYRREGEDTGVSRDQFLAEAGVGLYLGRGDIFQLAASAGMGGIWNLVRYDAERGTGRQSFGSFVARVGVEGEFLFKRIALVLSFRTYGVVTDRDRVRNRGALLDGASSDERQAPVPSFATMLVGFAGLAYRF